MSNERDKSTAGADESVARVYRDVANERVPEHLDRAVLDRAAHAARPGYARSRAWTRPLAWAATIVLTVTIVLELNRVQPPVEPPLPESAPSLDDTLSSAPPEPARLDEGSARPEGRPADLIQNAREKSVQVQKASVPVATEAAIEEPKHEADAPATGPEAEARSTFADVQEPTDPVATDTMRQRSYRPMEEAADAAPGRLTPASAPTAFAVGAEAGVSEPGQCPAETTRQASTWLECIEELEKAGLVDEAADERQRLLDAFPGIELP